MRILKKSQLFSVAAALSRRNLRDQNFIHRSRLANVLLVFCVIFASFSFNVRASLVPGETTLSELNCVACHQPSASVETRLASKKSPILGHDGLHLSPLWTKNFLLNPQSERPGTSMPDVLHGLSSAEKAETAEALSHYLFSLQAARAKDTNGFDAAVIAQGKALYHQVGCVACHAPQELPPESAAVTINSAELAELSTNSVPLGNLTGKFTVGALAGFLKDPLKTRPSGRMPAQHLSDAEARAIAIYLLRNLPAAASDPNQDFAVDKTKAEKGRGLFVTYNCAACHQLDQPGHPAAPLDKLANSSAGCLAQNPPAVAPDFALSARQREDLTALLAHFSDIDSPLSPEDQISRSLTVLNCYACHRRGDQGSPSNLRRAYFSVVGGADLGEEGTVPPHLNGVGAKLKPAWLEKVLFTGASVRPYMATRMPLFGEANVHPLSEAFLNADASQKGNVEPQADPVYTDGLHLVGTEGLSCIACHTFAGHPSLGVPALDLTTAPERLNAEWFRRYLLNPASLRPGTRMPSFWPDGVAADKRMLDGDTEKQIGAIWSYLASGKAAANLPPGLIRASLELTPKTGPLIYRNFIDGAGARAIGVGYPEKVNLAFDANQMSAAILWHGAFMDASRHRNGRGEGFEPPLGFGIVRLPSGPAFAILTNADSAWPTNSGKDAGYQFLGYVYDDHHDPEFRYKFDRVTVGDFFSPEKFSGNADTGFRRTLTFASKKSPANLWFRAAVGDKVENLGNGTFLVDGNLRLTFPPPPPKKGHDSPTHEIVVRASDGKTELLVPVEFVSGKAEILEEISW